MATLPEQPPRILPRTGRRSVRSVGLQRRLLGDSYHKLLTISWPRLMLVVVAVYLGVNLAFATGYWLDGNGITNAQPGSFADAFFFSVQTLATIGYGVMAPTSAAAHVLVTLEAFTGVLMTAMATGLMFAKFSRPTARVFFSDVAVISVRNGQPTLMFRVANERSNQIVEARLQASIVRTERTVEGEVMRRFHDLPLVRQHSIVFSLTWTAMHVIDEKSPLWGMTPEQMVTDGIEMLVALTGIDETMAQSVHARFSYRPEEFRWNHRFADVLLTDEQGAYIDYTKFHETVPLQLASAAAGPVPAPLAPPPP